mgnify:CR=1 FL=1
MFSDITTFVNSKFKKYLVISFSAYSCLARNDSASVCVGRVIHNQCVYMYDRWLEGVILPYHPLVSRYSIFLIVVGT